jgi:hypothetical protein
LDTRAACGYENQALYYLYRAKRDILHMLSEAQDRETREKLQQAFQQSMEQYRQQTADQSDMERERLEQHAKAIEELRGKQADLNRRLREHAAERLERERQGEETPPKAREQMAQSAQRQSDLADKTLQEQADIQQTQSYMPRLGGAPAREMAQAYYEMEQTQKGLRGEKPDEARDHGLKAEKRLGQALAEVKKAMQRSLGEKLDTLAKDAEQLARKQEKLAGESPKEQKAMDELAQTQKEQAEAVRDLAERAQRAAEDLKPQDSELARRAEASAKALDSKKLQENMQKGAQPQEGKPSQQARAQAAREMQAQSKALGDLAREFSMDESERLADAQRRAQDLAERQKALARALREEKMSKPGEKTAKQQEQREIARDTEDLGKKVARLDSARETDLERSLKGGIERAQRAMAESEKKIPQDPKQAAPEAARAGEEMESVREALERLLGQSLNQELAEAAEKGRKAVEAQRAAKQAAQRAARSKSEAAGGQPSPSSEMARQMQQQAKESSEALRRKLEDLADRADRADKPLARRVEDALKKVDPGQTRKDMAEAEKALAEEKPEEAAPHQEAALGRLRSGVRRLEDTLEDRTPLLARKLKNVQEEAEKLSEAAREAAKQLAEKPSEQPAAGQGDGEPMKEKLAEMADRADALKKRLEYLKGRKGEKSEPAEPSSDTKDWKQVLEDARKELESARDQYASENQEKARTGLKRASKGFQVVGQGVIEELERLTSRRLRRTPRIERAPKGYAKLVEEYYRALSEEK